MTTNKVPASATPAEKALLPFLRVGPPSDLESTAPTLTFERLREIDIPWDQVFEPLRSVGSFSSTVPMRRYFEQSWNFEVSEDEFDREQIAAVFSDVEDPSTESAKKYFTMGFFAPDPLTEEEKTKAEYKRREIKATPQRVPGGVVVRDGHGRLFVCRFNDKKSQMSAAALVNFAAYDEFWNRLRSVEQCFGSDADAQDGHTRVEYVDLTEKLILETYDELKAKQSFDNDLQDGVDNASPQLVQNVISMGLDIDAVNKLQQSVSSIRMRRFSLSRRLERLAQRAEELGYKLWVDEEAADDIEFPDGTKRKVEPGQLYRQYRRLHRWTTTIERVECTARQGLRAITSFFGIESPEPERWQEHKSHDAVVDDVKLVNVNDNALSEKLAQLSRTHQTYLFEQTEKGYRTQDGTTLREIMLRCRRDENFRIRCAVLLPSVVRSLAGERAVTGYNVFIAPLPGMVPTSFPRLALKETLSYRMAWRGTQLAELANSINLAPGETRTITVRRSYEQETTQTQRRTTVFDLQESESTDMTQELEREMNNQESSGWNVAYADSAHASAPIKGGGSVGGNMSRSFGYNKSVESLSRMVSKSVKNASRSVNKNFQEEVTTDTQSTSRVSNFDEYTSTIGNINEGRTLNLLFYRLTNQFDCGLYLEDLEFHVTPSLEIIAGSGVYDSIAFDVTELEGLLHEFSSSQLPLELHEDDEIEYLRNVLGALEKLLDGEYNDPKHQKPSPQSKLGPRKGVDRTDSAIDRLTAPTASVLTMPRNSAEMVKANPIEEDEESAAEREMEEALAAEKTKAAELERKRQRLAEIRAANARSEQRLLQNRLLNLKLIGNCIGGSRQTIQLVAPGLYVDSAVGAAPSTEAYSEHMRDQVLAQRRADVDLVRAEAEYRRALATRVQGANWIVGIMPYPERNSLMIGLKSPLPDGEWTLRIDGNDVADVDTSEHGKYAITLSWEHPQDWLADTTLLKQRIDLYHAAEGRLIEQMS